ncbi:MAG: class I adenylate-forming enzyme family protein [Gammaproteobacteria bacterium]|nr:class I adenylate-forming enzyme family protein [Gammaproteobacteria bacterium]
MLTRTQALRQLTDPGGDFELIAHTHDGRSPIRVYASGYKTLREVLLASRAFGEREFLIYEAERLTYAEHYRRVAQLACWLLGQGIEKGDRVGICMRNYPEWSITFFACQAIGAVAVTLNAWWIGKELVHGISDSGCRIAVLDNERYARLAPVRSELSGLQVLVTRDDTGSLEVTHWNDALHSHNEVTELPDVEVQPEDIASIMYTSGTTGFPKGALHTHRNHVTNVLNGFLGRALALALLPSTAPEAAPAPTPSSLQTFPFFHIGGLTGLYMAAASGGKLVLMYKWDVNQALKLIQREGVLAWAAVPTLVRELLESPNANAEVLGSVLSIASGGAPVPADLINQIGEQFNARIAPGNGYGATETTSAIIVNGGADYFARPGSVGRPVATVDIRIVDDHQQDCAIGVIGELWARGPNVFEGYWNKPAETQAAFSDGWFKTGDLGYVDDDGFYYVVDRKKDVIIRAGENVYCAEVEGVLHEHPEIVDVALIGLPHRSLGEEVAVVVELKPGAQVSEVDIQNHVASRIARYNVPSKVFFTDDPLPRTATGKILKRDLKIRYGG